MLVKSMELEGYKIELFKTDNKYLPYTVYRYNDRVLLAKRQVCTLGEALEVFELAMQGD